MRCVCVCVCVCRPQARPRTTGLALRGTPGARASARLRPSSWCGRATGRSSLTTAPCLTPAPSKPLEHQLQGWRQEAGWQEAGLIGCGGWDYRQRYGIALMGAGWFGLCKCVLKQGQLPGHVVNNTGDAMVANLRCRLSLCCGPELRLSQTSGWGVSEVVWVPCILTTANLADRVVRPTSLMPAMSGTWMGCGYAMLYFT